MAEKRARERLLSAALDLFTEHGVTGTSLQMIADRLGVTKAAVYHQFPAKEEIVLAVIGPPLAELAPIAEVARLRRTPAARRKAALTGIIDLVVRNRRIAAALTFDPMVNQLVRRHPAIGVIEQLQDLLTGPDPDDTTRVAVSLVSGGLMIAGSDPRLAALDDETLRDHLLATARRALR
ncbi:TetR/AcrR family transcriptional regulator [Actinoplanes sichuanensis]|uniref:TetR/AcrR family transcriptional regulator n=1 Tax=Actinoplanes sichuanensis TaxID=512349 RepID=A0ABW4A7U3_9ACTN|nr:TetR/AcrR family transcriptional regulator [Actinoplanes sichuanensis]BEL03326.1 TetR/AcrR family transcriptional regulator [Actinoplanes sichuanensis]